MSMKNPPTSAGIEPATFQFVTQHLNHCATTNRTTVETSYFTRCWQFPMQFCTHLYGEEREANKMQLIRCLLSNFYLNMFRASLCPSSGEQGCVLPHMVFCTGCAGCGCVELGRKLCALCEGYCST